MNNNHKKDYVIFFTALVVIGVSFVGGINYLKAYEKKDPSTLLADAASSAYPENVWSAPTTTVPVITAATSSAPTSTPSTTVATTTTTKPKTSTSTTTTAKPKPVTVATTTSTPTSTAASATTTVVAAATTTPIVPVPIATAPAPVTPATTIQTLPYSNSDFTTGDGWNQWYGNASEAGGTLTIGDLPGSADGGGSFLEGASAWTNYTFTATVNWVKGQNFNLLARYNNGDNYVFCEFDSDGTINVHRLSDGQDTLIGQGSVFLFPAQFQDLQASVTVLDDRVTCSLDGGSVGDSMYEGLPPKLWSGSIGFDTWDPTADNSEIIVTSISVTPGPNS